MSYVEVRLERLEAQFAALLKEVHEVREAVADQTKAAKAAAAKAAAITEDVAAKLETLDDRTPADPPPSSGGRRGPQSGR